MEPIRAVGLISGGLDSTLAAKLMIDQGIEVIGLHLTAPTACRSDVDEVTQHLGIKLIKRAKGEEYLKLIRNPRWGYGKNMNPCVDCRHFMFGLTDSYLEEFDAKFIFTGEVVGQRPMSQTRNRMDLIDRQSGKEGWVLRPLSAQLLPETEPEKRGWVDRKKLLGLSGRSRQAQMAMADEYGLKHYMSPGGGCLLTDPLFSRKLRDLLDNTTEQESTLEDVDLLRSGRHFRIDQGLKVVVGRDKTENEKLATYANESRWYIESIEFKGPCALVCGPADEANLHTAVRLIMRYSKNAQPDDRVRWRIGGEDLFMRLGDVPQEDLVQLTKL